MSSGIKENIERVESAGCRPMRIDLAATSVEILTMTSALSQAHEPPSLSQFDPERNTLVCNNFIWPKEANDLPRGLTICFHNARHIAIRYRHNGFCAANGTTCASEFEEPTPYSSLHALHDDLLSICSLLLCQLIYELLNRSASGFPDL